MASKTLTSVGPNASLVEGDLEAAVRKLKAEISGEIDLGGPVLAQSLTDLGLVDEYRLYLRPVVLGGGNPFFQAASPRPHRRGRDQADLCACLRVAALSTTCVLPRSRGRGTRSVEGACAPQT